jgi:hypothetical protein
LPRLNEQVEGLLDLVLALSIESARGFVKEKDLRASDQSAGDGDALLLPAG